MKLRLLCLISVLILAACNNPIGTAQPIGLPNTTQFPQPAPYPIDPEDGLAAKTPEIVLNWRFKGQLNEDEHFDVRVWKDGGSPGGIAWTESDQYDLTNYIRSNGTGVYHWSIVVIRGRDGKFEKELSPASPDWTFTVTEIPPIIPPEQSVKVPAGFKVQLFGTTTYPTAMAFNTDGTLYVTQQSGEVMALKDDNGDGVADRVNTISIGFNTPTGITTRGADIYISDARRVSILRDASIDKTDLAATTIITGLPSFIYDSHSNNGLVFGPDDRLYIPVGATTDHGPGEPVATAARVLVANADGSDLKTYATGFRNPYKVVFDQQGRMFVDDNGADQTDQVMPFIPGEELNLVIEGGDYGFPDIFGPPPAGSKSIGPIAMFEAHSIPTGMAVVPNETTLFPAEYKGNILIALWGTQPMGSSSARGHQVARVQLTETANGVKGIVTPFMTDITHPVSVAFGSDGALYIADWQQGFIFRVTYSK